MFQTLSSFQEVRFLCSRYCVLLSYCLIQGILPIAANEAGLATILGHEIAHYTLRHIAEKNSASQFFGIIGFIVAWMFGLPLDLFYKVQQVALELPNSRACETEGLLLFG